MSWYSYSFCREDLRRGSPGARVNVSLNSEGKVCGFTASHGVAIEVVIGMVFVVAVDI